MSKVGFPKAFGPFVVIEAQARSAGYEEKSDYGIIIETKTTQGEIPLVGKIVSIGGDVPAELLNKVVLLPNGKMSYLPHPDEVNGLKKREEIDDKLTVAHYTHIAAVYDEA